ncbi:UDP-N-acetylmuramoyl-L-alanine--D-glutamate ligase [Limnobacter sp. P1]|uniref:UDP-N-acetylmuramoyl-L-alanine--D-glutamate ligase n=1 Tax=Limnobacter olei TaxID=3031298 RepID=UPI0023B1365C|nr:UDP-N-acetylmuramoyl-L-alanine--D-glutamate ligase [Limnobacter sp. P1]
MNLLLNQSVLQVGLGESGLACARWALAQGARLTVIDTRETPPGLQELQSIQPDVRVFNSVGDLNWDFNRVVVSPGLPPSHPLMVAVLAHAAEHSTSVDSELDLFADALQALQQSRNYKPQVVGITGTNGKTTTTRMVECLAQFAGKKAVAAGNISPAALDALREQLEVDDLPDVWVLELSSFQLHWTKRLKFDASTVLNITQDHLDWHPDMREYAEDKFRIFSENGVCVLNRDDELVAKVNLPAGAEVITFGTSAPVHANDFGLIREGGMLWLAQLVGDQEVLTSTRRKKLEESEPSQKLLMPTEALQVVGLHNASNALAALALCQGLGMPMAKLLHGLRSYQGEPHRVQHVVQIDGVDYFDDSKGTNVGATVAALNGLAKPTVLIAGGDGKGQDFSPLIQPVSNYCKHVVLIGKDADNIMSALASVQVPCEKAASLELAVQMAASKAREGDCVLLSPACASLDMFRNYVHRAEVFVDAVRAIAADRGQPC